MDEASNSTAVGCTDCPIVFTAASEQEIRCSHGAHLAIGINRRSDALTPTAWNSLAILGLGKHTDPLFPAFPLCSGSKTCERLLDPALAKAAGFFLPLQDGTITH
jgi:hypothetical protein